MPELRTVTIERLGHRGDGIASEAGGRLFVPYALPGETVTARFEGERGDLQSVVEPSPDRIAPICGYYADCGGCAVQALSPAPYAAWKRGLVVEALTRAGLVAPVAPLVDAQGAGRRRATFHARVEPDGRVSLGFMRARAHDIVPIAACPLFAPGLDAALPAARAVATALIGARKPLDILATLTLTGLDLDLRGHGPLARDSLDRLSALAAAHDLARLSNHGDIVIERRQPLLRMGAAELAPPPGAFLQATQAGEDGLAARVVEACAGARRVADLFAGVGPFALRLASAAEVLAVDMAAPGLAALIRAARAAGLRPVEAAARDLFRRPLTAEELTPFEAVVFDPPRAGAAAQAAALAASPVPVVVAVSCDPQSFARDAATLLAGGYLLDRVEPLDQFRHSAHVELVARFRRPKKAARPRRLLG